MNFPLCLKSKLPTQAKRWFFSITLRTQERNDHLYLEKPIVFWQVGKSRSPPSPIIAISFISLLKKACHSTQTILHSRQTNTTNQWLFSTPDKRTLVNPWTTPEGPLGFAETVLLCLCEGLNALVENIIRLYTAKEIIFLISILFCSGILMAFKQETFTWEET